MKEKGKSISEPKSKTGGALDSKPEATMKSGKHGGGPATRESLKQKKTADAKSNVVIASVDQVAESKALQSATQRHRGHS